VEECSGLGHVATGAEGAEECVELGGAEGVSRARPYVSGEVEASDGGVEGRVGSGCR
jgi:hypothetical protein